MFRFTHDEEDGNVLSDDFLQNTFAKTLKPLAPETVQPLPFITTCQAQHFKAQNSQESMGAVARPNPHRLCTNDGATSNNAARSQTNTNDDKTSQPLNAKPQSYLNKRPHNTPFVHDFSPKKIILEKNKGTPGSTNRIPGPAGYLSNIFPRGTPPDHLMTKNVNDVLAIRSNSTPKSGNKKFSLSQFTTRQDNSMEAWERMFEGLGLNQNPTELTNKYNIAWVHQKASAKQLPRGKVPILAVTIKAVLEKTPGATSIIFKDRTGEILGTIYWGVHTDIQDKVLPGSACCFKKVSVFSPNAVKNYLNVTHENLLCIYEQGTGKEIFNCNGNVKDKVKAYLKGERLQGDKLDFEEPRRQLFPNGVESNPAKSVKISPRKRKLCAENSEHNSDWPGEDRQTTNSLSKFQGNQLESMDCSNNCEYDENLWPDDNLDELLGNIPENCLDGSNSTNEKQPSSFWPVDDEDESLDELLGSLPITLLF